MGQGFCVWVCCGIKLVWKYESRSLCVCVCACVLCGEGGACKKEEESEDRNTQRTLHGQCVSPHSARINGISKAKGVEEFTEQT